MLGRFDLGFRRNRMRSFKAARAMFAMVLLAGCSSVPDAINPIEWYKGAEDLVTGRERTEVATPTPPKGQYPDVNKTPDTRKDVAKGLPADKSNAKYAEPVRREVTPTKQLARRAPAADAPQVAQAADKVPPKPAVTKQELAPAAQPTQVAQADTSRLSSDRRAAVARDEGPNAPPASVNMTPPAPADIPETVPVPGRGRPRALQEHFQKRLAESAQTVVRPDIVDTGARVAYGRGEEEPIHLVPPSQARRSGKGGGKGMAAPTPEPAASFQVASVDFRPGSSDLTAADRASIAEAARVFKQTGGVIRVLGYAPTASFASVDDVQQLMGGLDASMKRANAVARELTKRGVPAGKIMVAADSGVASEIGAQVYLDVI